jgi:hypothetical protein
LKQVTLIVTGSSEDMTFTSTGFHYDSVVLNVSAYSTSGSNFTVNVGQKVGKKSVSGMPFLKS